MNKELLYKINLQLFADGGAEGDAPSQGGTEGVAEPPANSGEGDNINVSGEGDKNAGVSGPQKDDSGGAGQDDNNVRTSSQDPKIDAAFAKMRREIEKANKLIEQLYGEQYGIRTVDDLERAVQQQQQQQVQQQIQQVGIDPNVINQLIENHPVIQQAKQLAEDQRLLSNWNALKDEFGDLVKSPSDLPPEVWDLYDKGWDLTDAFIKVKRKDIIEHTKAVAKQQTLNNMNSKQHLKTEGDGASDNDNTVNIPSETLQMYIDMGMTKKEAVAHWKKLYNN